MKKNKLKNSANSIILKILIKNYIFITSLLFTVLHSSAQKTAMDVTGGYSLHGVMETASGFYLKPDSTFEFFFSQGALDRYGKGTWSMHGNNIVFNSSPAPSSNFAIVTTQNIAGNFIIIKIADKNSAILSLTEIRLITRGKILQRSTNSHGEAQFPKQPVDSILLQFRPCPGRTSRFAIVNKNHNYFEFRIEPWIAEVFFENFILTAGAGELTGQHPLLDGNEFSYEKEH